MIARVFFGEARATGIPANDRGFGYGDGLFETMRAHRGGVPWWEAHWSRLARGAARLRMALPDESRVRTEAMQLLDGGDGVLKLIVSRGSGGRGYAPDEASSPNWVLSQHPVPPPFRNAGLVLRWCETRLAVQPALAGIKHCNRLEQVLARAEWRDLQGQDREADEGLMCSSEGDVVCATAANLFIFAGGRWTTPRIDRCGVEGVCRAWAMDATAAIETRLTVGDIESAQAVFLCNAARGILPVAQLGAKVWPLHPQVVALQRRLSVDHPAFSTMPTELS